MAPGVKPLTAKVEQLNWLLSRMLVVSAPATAVRLTVSGPSMVSVLPLRTIN